MKLSISDNKNIHDLLEQLSVKYANSGQDLEHYLKGLLEANFEPYWDYINLESLLALQHPKTDHPDELIFIAYHQYSELFLKLILHELKQAAFKINLDAAYLNERVVRINRYVESLAHSFDIMIDGMEREQFLKFRMALLPASGFQSAQYRFVELGLTNIENLLHVDHRNKDAKLSLLELLDKLYWRQGAIDTKSGEKTLTLKQFEAYYDIRFERFVTKYRKTNLYQLFLNLKEAGKANQSLIDNMRLLDYNLNVNWRLAHFKSAIKYLKQKNQAVAATGGTNWTEYLPPRFQKVIAFPSLWTDQEKEEWGKKWVLEQINP